MKEHTCIYKRTGEQITVTLNEGDIIDMPYKGMQVEIGSGDTMCCLIDGVPDSKGFQPIPDPFVKDLCQHKLAMYRPDSIRTRADVLA